GAGQARPGVLRDALEAHGRGEGRAAVDPGPVATPGDHHAAVRHPPPGRLRRYRSAFVTLPRRNGKSVLAAGVALYLLFADDEPGSYVVSAAANREQTRVVFDQAARMVEASPALSAMAQVYRGEIVIPATGSRYKVLSRDSKVQHGMDLHGV